MSVPVRLKADGKLKRIDDDIDAPAHITVTDSGKLKLGTDGDFEFFHDGSDANIVNTTGDLLIDQKVAGAVMYFRTGATPTTAFSLTADQHAYFAKNAYISDGYNVTWGDGADLSIYHNNDHNYIDSTHATANLYFRTGSTPSNALTIDASQGATFAANTYISDTGKAYFGTGNDFVIFHDGSHFNMQNGTGNFAVNCGPGNAYFYTGVSNTLAFILNGSNQDAQFQSNVYLNGADKVLSLGATSQFNLHHDSSDGYIQNYTGDLIIDNDVDSQSIVFRTGPTPLYAFTLDHNQDATFYSNVSISDDHSIHFGDDTDFRINFQNAANTCNFLAYNDTAAFIFYTGSASLPTEALRIAADNTVTFAGHAYILDSSGGENRLIIGTGGDLNLFHDGSDNYIDSVGAARLRFRMDNGSTLVMDMAPTTGLATFYNDVRLPASADGRLEIGGSSSMLNIAHDGSTYGYIDCDTGYLAIDAATNIWLRTGGQDAAIYLDSSQNAILYGNVTLYENKRLYFDVDNTTYIEQTDAGDLAINATGQLDLGIDHASVGDMSNTGTNHFWRLGKDFGDVDAGGYYANQTIAYFHSTNVVDQSIQVYGYHSQIQVQAENTGDHLSVGPRCFSGQVQTQSGGTGSISGCSVFHAQNASVSGATIDNQYGIFIDSMTSGTNDNIGIYVSTPSGGTTNRAISVAGGVCYFGGSINQLGGEKYYPRHGDTNTYISSSAADTVDFYAGGLTLQLASTVATFSGDVRLGDSGKLELGASTDIQIWHDGSHGYFRNSTGELRFEVDTGTDFLVVDQNLTSTFAGQVGSALETQTDVDTSVTVDCDNGNVHHLTVDGNITTLTVSNPEEGFWYHFVIEQAGTGSYTVAWPASFKWPAGSAPTLSTAVGAVDVIHGVYVNSEFLMRYDLNHS